MKNKIIRRYIFILSIATMFSVLFMQRYAFANELNEIKAQMQKMQEDNQALQKQLNKQNETIESLSKKMEALENKNEVLSKEIKIAQEKPAGISIKEEGAVGIINIPHLEIQGFTDLGFKAKITDNGDNSSFYVGQVDLLITSKITDRVSFLVEPIFESNEEENSAEFELERAELKYSLSDFFNIKIGRMHTPFGYWNQVFHHGTWFQTSISRPEIYSFEDSGKGILPIHGVGIELLGTKAFEAFDLEYNIDILNGRGRTKTTVQNAKDSNDSKAVNVLFGIKPHFIDGLKFGADIYRDVIPSNPPARSSRINELIFGGFITYIHDKLELLGEVFNIRHDDKTSGRDFNTLGYYLQGGYKVNKFTPYYRFDFINFKNGDPYFTPDDIDIRKHTLGLRWDILAWNALKFEYSHSDRRNRDNEDSFSVNSSFAF